MKVRWLNFYRKYIKWRLYRNILTLKRVELEERFKETLIEWEKEMQKQRDIKTQKKRSSHK